MTAVLRVPSQVTCGTRNKLCKSCSLTPSIHGADAWLAMAKKNPFRYTNKQRAFHRKCNEGMKSCSCGLILSQRVRVYCCQLLCKDMKILLYGGSFSESKKEIISWVMANTLGVQDNSRVQRGKCSKRTVTRSVSYESSLL